MLVSKTASRGKPVLAFVVTEDWYFLSHRLPMARAAQAAGFDVHVICNVNKGAAAIKTEGFQLHPVAWRRGSVHPLSFISNVRAVRRIYRKIFPAIVHHVALQPSIVGSLAATGLPSVRLNALTGLGFAFGSTNMKARLMRPVLLALLRYVLKHPQASVLVQNFGDRATMRQLGITDKNVFMIQGSGVETDWFTPLPEVEGPPTVAFVGRLLEYKGVRLLIQAHEILLRRGEPVRLLIAGSPDPANPVSIPPDEIASWADRPNIELLGHVDDVRTVWKRAHVAVFPSKGGEGLPKSLLEAAACGRPIIATDVSGCREIARDGINALLVAPNDPEALADAICQLAQNTAMRRHFGVAGRELVEKEFSATQIGKQIVDLYRQLTSDKQIKQIPE